MRGETHIGGGSERPNAVPTLAGEKVTLRALRRSDASSIYQHSNDRQLSRWMPNLPYPNLMPEVHAYVGEAQRAATERSAFVFGIVSPPDGEVVGVIALKEIDWENRRADVGCWVSRRFQRRGYATEAFKLLLRFGFQDLKLRRLAALVIAPNAGSLGLLEKVGFTREGTMRQDCRLGRRWYDVHCYGLLNREFRLAGTRREGR